MKARWISKAGLMLLVLAGCGTLRIERDRNAPAEEWPTYGNDPGSSRYSPLAEIMKENVRYLKVAWTYHTGDVSDAKGTWSGKRM